MASNTSVTTGQSSPEQGMSVEETADFGAKLLAALNGAALMLMTSIGHRTGLFDVMRAAGPLTVAQLAAEAGLSARHVREWLGAMLSAGVVDHDSAAGTYSLPTVHAGWLTRAASPNNLAVMAQWVAVLGAAEDHVVDAFGHGRGVAYSAYRRVHAVMAEDCAQRIVSSLVQRVIPLVPGLTTRLEAGIDVLDVACGAGGAMIALASAYRRSHFTGYDCSLEAVAVATAEASRRGLRNVHFTARDVAESLGTSVYDLITAFDAIHDQTKPGRVLSGVLTALRPGGTFLMADVRLSGHPYQDRGHPVGTFLYTLSCMHRVPVSLAGGGPGPGATWGEERALKMLRAAGFTGVRVERLEHDVLNNYYIARCGAK